jgi:hypothetical protein
LREGILSDLREIARAPVPRGALLTVLAATSVLCGPTITFTAVLVSVAFHGNSSDFSAAVGAFGLGGLLGATGLLAIPAEQDRRGWSSRLAVVYGLIVTVIGLVPWFWGVPALMVLAGASMTVSNTAANLLLQGAANPSLLGQTVSLFMLATRGGIRLGALLTGLSIDMIGIRPALLVDGALAVVVHLVIGRAWLRSPPAGLVTTFGTT